MFKFKSILSIVLFLSVVSCDDSKEELAAPSNTIEFQTGTISIDPNVASSLGYEKLVINEGDYQINRCGNSFGSIVFDLKELLKAEGGASNVKNGFGPRIRIGTRKSDCKKGIGFRCGLAKVELQQAYDVDRDKLVEFVVDEDLKTVSIEFLEPVDWEKLKGE